ncbi:MAG: carboxypeptidase-like regulatory domain-containing protein [Bacteroidales bacterium]
MKRLLLLTVIALRVVLLTGQEKELLFTGSVRNMAFAEFSDTIEARTGTKIFFRTEWTVDIRVTGSWENATPLSIITMIVGPRGLYSLYDGTGNIIITKGFAVRNSFEPVSRIGDLLSMTDTVTTVAGNILESEIITFGNPADRNLEGRVLLSGFITNNATGEPVAGASIQIRELGAGVVTNQDGYYLLAIPRGSYKVEYRSLGSVDTYRNVNLYAGGKLSVAMDERVIAIRDAVVTASRRDKMDRLESGMARMNIMTIRLSPSSLGEADLIKSMLLLPGVQTGMQVFSMTSMPILQLMQVKTVSLRCQPITAMTTSGLTVTPVMPMTTIFYHHVSGIISPSLSLLYSVLPTATTAITSAIPA